MQVEKDALLECDVCRFQDQTDVVHVDEKWFYLMEGGWLLGVFPNADGTFALFPWDAQASLAAADSGSESEDESEGGGESEDGLEDGDSEDDDEGDY